MPNEGEVSAQGGVCPGRGCLSDQGGEVSV